ncbi:MMPL family transporter [Streptosporangiaceae bacterium NEAU-GS5]|nr:MMPL family transporter [Streptosporangiaceae bacterium NEAU-GS5]
MFEAWGRFVERRRWWVLAAALLLIVFMGVWGTRVFGSLTSGGFAVPGTESAVAADIAARDLGRDDADVIALYSTPSAPIAQLKALPGVTDVTQGPVSGSQTFAILHLAGETGAERHDAYVAIKDRLTATGARLGGQAAIEDTINRQVSSDIGRAEAISMPILLILLVLIFGSLAAAGLPLAIGAIAILGSFTALRLLTYVTDVSVYSINITTILGLGLAIDYGLFVVARYRDELRRDPATALARTMATAGRTVAVSGVTVAVSLSSLLLFPQAFLRSMGYGGMATVVVDMLAALTVLPALLAVLGPRVNALRVRRVEPRERGAWFRLASSVMRRPVRYVLITTVILVALGLPFLRVSWGGTDERVLPAGAEARQVSEVLVRDFPQTTTNPIEVVVTGLADPAAYTDRLRHVAGVTDARVTGRHGATTRIAVTYPGIALSAETRDLVQRVRQEPPPTGRAYVGGATARLADQLDSLGSRLPWMALVVIVATFVLLFLAFGSIVLPIKAILMNVLSLSAMFGAIVWIFQDGHLADLLGFTATGTIEPSMPILMLAVIFGLSMDYEVFLLSRVREQYDLTGDTTRSVAEGLQRTGGIITGAALLLIVVVGAFSTSGITFIKLIGVGMLLAILIDATIVRALLVPATMRLLGRVNWWAPRPLRRLYARYGIREESVPEPALN